MTVEPTAIQYAEELEQFAALVARAGCKTALELGTGRGGLAMLLTQVMGEDSLVVTVDLPEKDGGTPEEYINEALKGVPAHSRLVSLRGLTQAESTRRAIHDALGGRPVDLLFIDTEHVEAQAVLEYKYYKDLLANFGMIAFHDICMPALWPMWNRLRGTLPPDRSIEIIRNVQQRDCGIGVLLGRH